MEKYLKVIFKQEDEMALEFLKRKIIGFMKGFGKIINQKDGGK